MAATSPEDQKSRQVGLLESDTAVPSSSSTATIFSESQSTPHIGEVQGGGLGFRHVISMLLCFCNVCLYVCRANASVAVVWMYPKGSPGHGHIPLILSAFYFGYPILQVVAGHLATRFGGKPVLCFAILMWSLCTLMTVPAYKFCAAHDNDGSSIRSVYAVFLCRMLTGLFEGFNYPVQARRVADWTPKSEVSRAWSRALLGQSLGTILVMSGCPFMAHIWGWESIFYFSAGIGFLWFGFFALFGSSTPEESRFVSNEEANYIRGRRTSLTISRQTSEIVLSESPPFGQILTNRSFMCVVLCHFTHNWAFYLLLSVIPSFYKDRFNADYAEMGLLSVMPWIALTGTSVVVGSLADAGIAWLQKRRRRTSGDISRRDVRHRAEEDWWSRNIMRKVFSAGSDVTQALTLFGLAFCYNSKLCGVLTSVGVAASGLSYVGFYAAFTEMSPIYGAYLMGISNGLAGLPGIFGNLSVEMFHGDYAQVFIFAGLLQLCGVMPCLFFSEFRDQGFGVTNRISSSFVEQGSAFRSEKSMEMDILPEKTAERAT